MAKKRKLLEAPEEDFATWQRAADSCGMALAPWMRRQLNIAADNDAEARRQIQEVLPNGEHRAQAAPGVGSNAMPLTKRTFEPDFK